MEEEALFLKHVGATVTDGSKNSKVQGLENARMALRRNLSPGWRIRWLWAAAILERDVGQPKEAVVAALEGYNLALEANDAVYAAIFQVLRGNALALTEKWEQSLDVLQQATAMVESLDDPAWPAIAPDLVRAWTTIPSISARIGLPKSVELLGQALESSHFADNLSRAQGLTILAEGILESRHVLGEAADFESALVAASESVRLSPVRTQAQANAILVWANALCLGWTDDPIGTLEHARDLIEESARLQSSLGYDGFVERTIVSWLSIARRLANIGRDPPPPLPVWINDYFSTTRNDPPSILRGQANMGLAQLYLDDAVRGSLSASAQVTGALEQALICRPPERYPFEGAVALMHQSAFLEDSEADEKLALAKDIAMRAGRPVIEWAFLLQRALKGSPTTARKVIGRVRLLISQLPKSETEITGLLLEVAGEAHRRLEDKAGAIDAFNVCLKQYEKRLSETGAPTERAERLASRDKIAEELYKLLISEGRFSEALLIIEKSKLRASSIGAALRAGFIRSDESRRIASDIVATQARFDMLATSDSSNRASAVKELRSHWQQLDELPEFTQEFQENRVEGTMFVFRATNEGGYAHILHKHVFDDDPELVVHLPRFTRYWLNDWIKVWLKDVWTENTQPVGRPSDLVLEDISDDFGTVIFEPVIAVATRLNLDLSTMTIVTTGGLGLLPLTAAKVGKGKRLIDVGNIRFAPSIQSWQAARHGAENWQSQLGTKSRLRLRGLGISHKGLLVGEELKAISRSMKCEAEDCSLQSEASLDSLRSLFPGSDYVHFSGHGQAAREDRRIQAGLDLGSGQTATIGDLLTFDSGQTRMVSLSACQTGQFETGRAPDEFLGSAYAVFGTGTAAVTAALWNVNALVSTLFHVKMYDLIAAGSEPLAAHADAVRWLRGASRAELSDFIVCRIDQDYRIESVPLHGNCPFSGAQHWAAFLYIGF